MSYDSTKDTLNHIGMVEGSLSLVADLLRIRGYDHDASKLDAPEKQLYDDWAPRLKKLTYGSEEYRAALVAMGPALQHHYQHNSHHPEHYASGIYGMSLLDLIEMLADWRAASRRQGGGFSASLAYHCQRFEIGDQLSAILTNTARELGWLE